MRTLTQDEQNFYWNQGYLIVKNVFNQHEVAALAAACDKWKQFGHMLARTWRNKNTVIWVDEDEQQEPLVRGMQWPSYFDPTFDTIRRDQRLLELVKPLIGDHLKQIINQVHWKRPGSKVSWALHRDVRSRKPNNAFRDLQNSYVQTGIAIDPHRVENGAMYIVPGSHKDVSNDPEEQGNITFNPEYENDPRKIPIEMDPGDVAFWTPFTVHGGGINTTTGMDRRLYINGFVIADNCDRGELVWDHGKTVLLEGEQAIVQFDGVHDHKGGFYPGDRNLSTAVSD